MTLQQYCFFEYSQESYELTSQLYCVCNKDALLQPAAAATVAPDAGTEADAGAGADATNGVEDGALPLDAGTAPQDLPG